MAPIDGDPMADVLTGQPAPASPPPPPAAAPQAPVGPAPHIDSSGQPTSPMPPPVNQPEPGRERMVPLPELLDTRHRLQSERARAEELARHNEQLVEALQRIAVQQQQPPQPPPPPIDPNVDPAGALAQMQQAMRQEVEQIRRETQFTTLNQHLNNSEREARRDFGHQTVDAALNAAMQSGMADHFRNQADPYSAMVEWHQAQELARAIGPDPRRFVDRIRMEERQRLIAEMRNGAPPPSNIPPSLAGATRSADGAPIAVQGSKDFFENMLANPRSNRGPGGQR